MRHRQGFLQRGAADVVDEVVQIHGGYGFIQEYPAEGSTGMSGLTAYSRGRTRSTGC